MSSYASPAARERLANRRMSLAVIFSLALHALILSLQFGLPGAGLPSLEMPFQKKRAAPGSLTVQLSQSAAAPASQQSPQDQASKTEQTATAPAPNANPLVAQAVDHAVTAAPPASAAKAAASSLTWVKLAPAKTVPANPTKSAKAPAKAASKPVSKLAAASSSRQKKVLAPDTQRLLTQLGWNEEGFVVAANPPEIAKPEHEDLRKHYDDIQQDGVEDPDERARRQHEIEQKRQQKLAQDQLKAQQKLQQQVTQQVAQAELQQAQQQIQQQLQQQTQQITEQIQAEAEQQKKIAEQIKLAEAEKARQQQVIEQQQAQAQQVAEQARAQQEQLAEQQQRQERQNLIAQRQAEQAQQRQYKAAQKVQQLSEAKPDLQQQMQQMQQVQQANQQELQKLDQQVQRDEQQRLAAEARERASTTEASQLAQQKAAQQRADARHEKLNSQLRQGAASDLQSLSSQIAQAPVAIAAAKPAPQVGTGQGSDPLAAARPVNEGGNKAHGNAERGNSSGPGLASNRAGLSRPAAPLDLAGSVRDQLKQLDRSRASPMATSDEGDKRRRRSLLGEAERDVPLRMYIDSWKHKVERNANLNYSQLAKDRARGDPLVTVAIRSDGSVEDIIINRSSGRADLDEAVRRIIKINAKYAAFPPNVAAVYDVIEIRKVWLFEEVLRVIDEIR